MTSMVRGQGSNQYQDKMRPDDPRLAVPGQQAFMPNGAPAYDEDAYQSLMKIVGPIGMENELHSYAAHVPQYGDARAIPAAHVPQIASYMIQAKIKDIASEVAILQYMQMEEKSASTFEEGRMAGRIDRDTLRRGYDAYLEEQNQEIHKVAYITPYSNTKEDIGKVGPDGLRRTSDIQLIEAIAADKGNKLMSQGYPVARMKIRKAMEEMWDAAQDANVEYIDVGDERTGVSRISMTTEGHSSEADARAAFFREYAKIGIKVQGQMWDDTMANPEYRDARCARVLGIEKFMSYHDRLANQLFDKNGKVLHPEAASREWRLRNPTAEEQFKAGAKAVGKGLVSAYKTSKRAKQNFKDNHAKGKTEGAARVRAAEDEIFRKKRMTITEDQYTRARKNGQRPY